jgi:hypothetical protein
MWGLFFSVYIVQDDMADTPSPKPFKDNSKMGKKIAAQSQKAVRERDQKRADFASGDKRFTEGK